MRRWRSTIAGTGGSEPCDLRFTIYDIRAGGRRRAQSGASWPYHWSAPVLAAPCTHLADASNGRVVLPLLLWRRGSGRGGPVTILDAVVRGDMPAGCRTKYIWRAG